MKVVLAHARAQTLELARYPAYVVPTLLFPAAFFLVFAAPADRAGAAAELATFAGFAALGVAFFQFGVGIAADRASPWEAYLRTLPVAPRARLGARTLAAVPFALAASAAVVAAGLATTEAALPAVGWLELALVLTLGTVPFAMLGIALGFLAPPRAALPIANLFYLGLSYAGGLWQRPSRLPAAVAAVSPYVPTRAFGDVLAAVATGQPFTPAPWARLAAFAGGFALLALWAYRLDEGRSYR